MAHCKPIGDEIAKPTRPEVIDDTHCRKSAIAGTGPSLRVHLSFVPLVVDWSQHGARGYLLPSS
jgi:hypothetical protein